MNEEWPNPRVRPFFVSGQNRGLNVITGTRTESSDSCRDRACDRSQVTRETIHFATAFTFIGMPLASS